MTLILQWTARGYLWMDDEIRREWKWSKLPADLKSDIAQWFHGRPTYDALLAAFEAQGAKLATRVQAATCIPVRYVPSTASRFAAE